MPREERVTFSNPRGQRLVGILHHPDGSETAPAVILFRGIESNKESEKLVAVSREPATTGIAASRFGFG